MLNERLPSCSATQRSETVKHHLFGRVVDQVIAHIPLLLQEIAQEIEQSPRPLLLDTLSGVCARHQCRGHLAVFSRPYVQKMLQLEKTIESRLSKHRILPFRAVHTNDIVFLKMTAGPICAVVQVIQAQFFGPLSAGEARNIMEQYQDGLHLDEDFKQSKQDSRYASFLFLSTPVVIQPVRVRKTDRRPWVVLTK